MSSKNHINKIPRRGLIAGAAALPIASSCGFLGTSSNLDQRALAVREQVFQKYPSAAQASQQASATLLFPEIVKAGFAVGGSHGDGVMYVNNEIVARYNLTAASFGIQAGIESFSMMTLLMTPLSVQRFQQTLGFDVGADVEYALPREGVNYGTTANSIIHDVYVLIFNQAGLMVGATVQGAKYTQI